MDKSAREKFKERMNLKREERNREIENRKGRGNDSIFEKKGMVRKTLGMPYRIAASTCGLAYRVVANKYMAGAAALTIAFGGGVIYGVNNAESIKRDYSIAVDSTAEFVRESLDNFEENKEKAFYETVEAVEKKAAALYQDAETPKESVTEKGSAKDLEGVAAEAGAEGQY